MAATLFNFIRGAPTSPSVGDAPVADYCGTFCARTGSWSPPNTGGDGGVRLATWHTPHFPRPPTSAELATEPADCGDHHQQQQQQSLREHHVHLRDLDAHFARMVRVDTAAIVPASSNSSRPPCGGGGADGGADGVEPRSDRSAAAVAAAAGTAPPATPKLAPPRFVGSRPVRLVMCSDTHQFHRKIALPLGDVLIVAGDILLSDRFNPSSISSRFVADFFDWLHSHPHATKIFVCGNHDLEFFNMGVPALRKLAAPAIFLDADEIVDVCGLRFFGNSYSHGTSSNRAFQSPSVREALRRVPHERVVDAATAAAAGSRQALPTLTSDGDAATVLPAAAPPRPRPPHCAVDVLVTHSTLESGHESIVRDINPLLHVSGHHHEDHGMERGHARVPAMPARFEERASRGVAAATTAMMMMSGAQPDAALLSRCIPQLNVSIVAVLHMWHPQLHPPMVVDVIPRSE